MKIKKSQSNFLIIVFHPSLRAHPCFLFYHFPGLNSWANITCPPTGEQIENCSENEIVAINLKATI